MRKPSKKTAALVSLLLAAILLLGGCGTAPAAVSPSSKVSGASSSSVSSSSSELQVEVPSVASLEIPAGGTTEQTLTAIFSKSNDLFNVGRSEDVYNDYFNHRFQATSTEYAAKYVAPFVDNYLKALCGDNYQSNPSLAGLLKDYTEQASGHLDLWLSSKQIDDPRAKMNSGTPIYQYNTSYESYVGADSQNDFTVKVSEASNASTIWPNGNFGGLNITDTIHITLTNEKDDSGNEVAHITGYSVVSQQNS